MSPSRRGLGLPTLRAHAEPRNAALRHGQRQQPSVAHPVALATSVAVLGHATRVVKPTRSDVGARRPVPADAEVPLASRPRPAPLATGPKPRSPPSARASPRSDPFVGYATSPPDD